MGEAPGRIEDLKGKPFTGPAGQFLRRELKHAGLDPYTATYFNAVCCWPHGKPEPEALMACRQNLIDQWSALDCEYVLVCGRVALEAVLPHANDQTRNKPIPIHGKVIFAVYHPAYVLRDRQVLRGWQESLRSFMLVVKGFAELLDYDRCIYCRKRGGPACSTHSAWWRKDQHWKMPKPPQLELDL